MSTAACEKEICQSDKADKADKADISDIDKKSSATLLADVFAKVSEFMDQKEGSKEESKEESTKRESGIILHNYYIIQ